VPLTDFHKRIPEPLMTLLVPLAVIALWLLLQLVILPKLGCST
jgi:hypothetical protein